MLLLKFSIIFPLILYILPYHQVQVDDFPNNPTEYIIVITWISNDQRVFFMQSCAIC
jgi:hypothetical protein